MVKERLTGGWLHAQMKTAFVFRWGQQIFRLVRLLFAQMAREMQGRVWSGSIRVSGLGALQL